MTTRTTPFATNDVLTANDLNALAGGWNAYTPTLTGFTAGNGTATGAYLQFGDLVIFRARFVMGSTSAAAATAPQLSLPVTSNGLAGIVRGSFSDTGTAAYSAGAIISASTAALYVLGSNGRNDFPSTTSPFTWTTGDIIEAFGLYEAA